MTLIKKLTYLFDNVSNSSFFRSSAFTSLFFDIFLLFFIILNWILKCHKFMKNGNVFHFFSFDFDSIFVLQKISGMNFNILTYWLHSTVHVQFLFFEIKMNLFVFIRGILLSKEMLQLAARSYMRVFRLRYDVSLSIC